MIRSIRHKGLRQLWENDKAGKLPADQVSRIRQMLEVIDSAQLVPQDFEFFRSWKIHALKGEWKGYWSLAVKENWRIIFRFENQDAFDLDYLDYH
jgi:proteic killer suppression protein